MPEPDDRNEEAYDGRGPAADPPDVRRRWLHAGTAVAVGSAAVALLLAGPLAPSGPAVLGLLVVGSVLWGVAVTVTVFALRRRNRRRDRQRGGSGRAPGRGADERNRERKERRGDERDRNGERSREDRRHGRNR